MPRLDTKEMLLAAIEFSNAPSKYAFAKQAGMAPQALHEYLKGDNPRQMSPAKLEQVLEANGIRATVTYSALNDALKSP